MKYIRLFDNQQDFQSVYNETPTFETISICKNDRTVYHPYAGQVGNLYKWGDSLYTSVRNPLYHSWTMILDSSGNETNEYVDDVNERLVYSGGYDEPWVSYVPNNGIYYTKSKLYTGGSLLDLRDIENNPNVVPAQYNSSISSVVDKYYHYALKDFILDYWGTTIQYILMDWDENGWVYNFAGKMKVARWDDGVYMLPGCWIELQENNRLHLYIND